VLGYDEAFVAQAGLFYEALAALGGRYVFRCRRGRCWSIIEGDEGVDALIAATPGLLVEECSGGCRESGVMLPPPPAPATARPPLPSGGELFLAVSGGEEVRLPASSLWGHIGIYGSTGAGKTHSAARVARCAAEAASAAVAVLDWHNEYYRLLPGARLLSGPRLPRPLSSPR
jgi:hypothetical protein